MVQRAWQGRSSVQFNIGDREIAVNIRDFDQLSAEIRRRFSARQGFALATINLDHLVKLRCDPAFAAAYAAHDLVVADGNPVVALSRLAGRPVALLPGADLVRPLCALAAGAGVPVALVGSDDDTLARAAGRLMAEMPGLDIAWCHAPPMGFDPESAAADAVLDELKSRNIGLCLLALGAPKQERLAARGKGQTPGVGFASIGAGLDFIAGRQRRAPLWMRRLALEWLWRALGDLRRLGPRYARCIAILPGLMLASLRLRLSGRGDHG
ncbi:WecB/TagA/CpsF family glycosyltransferase [Roseovarius amoyensis]|uniref:WecB/TagA/CpsF family glycosyltransferase n=1 Tax=Roseovarius amoyensis TaxID=2211448 RepID=UPI000DBE0D9C|nr:WecB/TagA/CpsF family glycosyltransferase [Roseovarius amoyensis]